MEPSNDHVVQTDPYFQIGTTTSTAAELTTAINTLIAQGWTYTPNSMIVIGVNVMGRFTQ